jgi:hypothetical protein
VPAGSTIDALNQMYYNDCLQELLESAEAILDFGLELPTKRYTEFDLSGLLRMDQAAQMDLLVKSVGGGIHAPDEARAKVDLPPVPGGQYPYLQQQNYSLEALAKRDAQEDPFGTKPAPAPAPAAANDEDDAEDAEEMAASLASAYIKGLMDTSAAVPIGPPVPLLEVDSQIRASVGIVSSLAASVVESQRRADSTLDAVVAAARHTEQSQARVAKSVDDLASVLKMPVVPVFGDDGMLKGSRRVEKLEDE